MPFQSMLYGNWEPRITENDMAVYGYILLSYLTL